MAVTVQIMVSQVMRPCILAGGYKHFREPYCLRDQSQTAQGKESPGLYRHVAKKAVTQILGREKGGKTYSRPTGLVNKKTVLFRATIHCICGDMMFL
jgi:hypothetical protein